MTSFTRLPGSSTTTCSQRGRDRRRKKPLTLTSRLLDYLCDEMLQVDEQWARHGMRSTPGR